MTRAIQRAATWTLAAKTWEKVKTPAGDPHGWYCYTPVEFVGDAVLLGHCAGDRRAGGLARTQVTRIPVAWLYR